jgi:transient receptor potential cation channel subfamily C member 4
VECDRFYNKFFVRRYRRTSGCFLFSSKSQNIICVDDIRTTTMCLFFIDSLLQTKVQKEMMFNQFANILPREKWDTWDPMLISEGLFSAANIFSSLKLVYIFSVNPHLGPLQVSLSRMVTDIMKFFFLYVLVLFAFSSGLNQLLWQVSLMWFCPTFINNSSLQLYFYLISLRCFLQHRYYADLEKKKCPDTTTPVSAMNSTMDPNACIVWRRFAK